MIAQCTDEQLAVLKYEWGEWARDNQLAPKGDWSTWMILAGRGFGKTRSGAEFVRDEVKHGRAGRVALIARTASDVRDTIVEGESGLLACSPPWDRPIWEPSKRRLKWRNGAQGTTFSADEPDLLRGPQHDLGWCDELASWRYPDAWDQFQFGLRLGAHPRAIVTTTPRPTRMVKDIIALPTTVVTRGTTYENRENLAPSFFISVVQKYEGTRLGRQELNAELLDDNPHALFKRSDIDAGRLKEAPQMLRVVVAIDPAVTSSEESDETGLIGAGVAYVGGLKHGFILSDRSLRSTPNGWARQAVLMMDELKADRIVAEVNNGGEMVISTIRSISATVATKSVTASRGKAVRAEPVASLYEQHRIHHVGSFPILEDQMCEFDPMDPTAKSPDRMDALVWAITDLMLEAESGHVAFYAQANQKRIEAKTNGK